MNHIAQHAEPALARRPTPARSARLGAENGSYLARIKEFPILSEREERRLIEAWYMKGDRSAYDSLIGSHLRLVPKIAQKYAGYGVPVADLIGEGNLGLLQSAARFDPSKGFRFSTYARWWIKAAMLNFVLQTWSLIKIGNGAAKSACSSIFVGRSKACKPTVIVIWTTAISKNSPSISKSAVKTSSRWINV